MRRDPDKLLRPEWCKNLPSRARFASKSFQQFPPLRISVFSCAQGIQQKRCNRHRANPAGDGSNERTLGGHALEVYITLDRISFWKLRAFDTGGPNVDNYRTLFHHIDG